MTPKLTKAQRRVLTAIRAHFRRHGMPPTRADLCKALGFSSPNAAQDHLNALSRKGAIKMIPNISRGIRLA